MAGLSLTLETAKGALLNTQVQLQTATNNITNANTKGYSKQRAVMQENPAYFNSPGWIGTGANVLFIEQLRDQFLERRLMGSMSDESQYTSLASELQSIQSTISDSGDTGISQALGAFYDSWDKLAQNPAGSVEQTGVYEASQNLANTLQSTYIRLNQISTTEIPGQIQDTVDKANTLIDQIAQYNTAIFQNESSGYPANDLRDARYQAMKDLSQLIPVNFTQDPTNGMYTVDTTDAGGSLNLVTGATATHIDITSTITGGQFGGLQTAQTDINDYISRLNDFTSTLITQVNSIHGALGGPNVFTGSDASDITASNTFFGTLSPADEGTAALNMAGLQGTQITFGDGKTTTLGDYWSDVQKQVGLDVQQANSNSSFNTALRTQLETQEQSVSGVSLDEEMVDVIQFQQLFQAAAKVIDKTSQLMTAVIDMVQ